MSERGLRSILQPVLFLGIALILHGILFLIPAGGPVKRDGETTRGVRVKAYVDRSAVPAPTTSPPPSPPEAVKDRHYSAMGSGTATGDSKGLAAQGSGSQSRSTSGPGEEGTPSPSEWRDYISKLGSEGVQGRAKESARKARQGWKGSGVGSGAKGTGPKTGESGSGMGASGTGSEGDGAGLMDPRVRMVVTSYPSTGIEKRYTPVRYPDLKIKKHQYTSGWWNVYIEITTDKNGKIVYYDVLRPETNGALERQFVTQVKDQIATWSFDPAVAEIHVDVRFYVE